MTVGEFQQLIKDIYFEKDSGRGVDGTFRWFTEEVGELARAIRKGEPEGLDEEFADVFAWLVSLASLSDVDLEQACVKYRSGCPKCDAIPCKCEEKIPDSKDKEI